MRHKLGLLPALLVLIAILPASRCVVGPTPPEPPNGGTGGVSPADAGADAEIPEECVPPDAPDDCDLACSNMCRLDCPGWQGSPGGKSCADVCRETEGSGVARFCPRDLAAMRGAGGECDPDELQRAFEACE